MKTCALTDITEGRKPCVATIGFFDGVHRGHQYLIEQVKAAALQLGYESTVITFRHHPRQVMNSNFQPLLLNTAEEKIFRLSLTNIDNCIMLDFDQEMAQMTARDFMEKILHERLNVKVLVIGYDNRFGHNRAEGFEDYVRYGQEIGIEVIKAKAFC
jgi:riboflavin kinase/FMN adenylyltransferase